MGTAIHHDTKEAGALAAAADMSRRALPPPSSLKGKAPRLIPLLRSCERCRRRKQRCDGEQPACGRCKTHGSSCNYRQSGRFRKRFPRDAPEHIDAAEQQEQQQQQQQSPASSTSGKGSEQASPILFMLPPELSPSGMSPENAAGFETPLVDPMAVLRSRDLPDLAQGLAEPIAQQMAGLIGGFTASAEKRSGEAAAAAAATTRVAPNMALLDEGAEWLHSDADAMALATLQAVSQRHQINASAPTLLSMLRASFVDSATRMRTRQFWATLNAGRAGDFAVLAHAAIAAREAQLSSHHSSVDARIEGACFDAAQREWTAGHVVATTGAVYGLLLLSEYGFQTGRTAVLWDYATHALATVRRIRLRAHAYPWRSARMSDCDVEYEHMLACFWCTWGRMFTAAQALARRIDTCNEDDDDVPEMPQHNVCQDLAQPLADAQDAPGAVRFAPALCCHSAQCSYMAATWRCCALAVPVHNCHVDLLEKRCKPASFLDTLRAWDERLQQWRAAWHPAWEPRLAAILGNTPGAPPPRSPTDSWLVILAVMYSTLRLRMHRAALALLLRADERPLLPGAALTPIPTVYALAAAYGALTGDALRDAIERHRCHLVCLESAAALETILAACNRVHIIPLTRFGIWVVFVLEQVASVHCARMCKRMGAVTQLDAVHRLAMVMRHLIALRKWTAALYVYTSIVKALLVDDNEPDKWTVDLDRIPAECRAGAVHFSRVENSPWPQNHVLTMLIRELEMVPRQFCAYTVPVVYASIMTSSAPIPASVRMRIASLL
ncbi:hypothetical protein LPJ81_005404, partial [Coemansia sp. IMI 209127]